MNAEKPFFTVIVPAYNRSVMLRKLISSVISQQFTSWELLIIDDGSTEDIRSVVSNFSDTRIRYIYQNNSERGAARNNGIKNASGDYVCFLDSDDYILPDHLATANKLLSSEYKNQVIHLGYRFESVDGHLTRPVRKLPPVLNQLLKIENAVSCNGIFIPASVATKYLFNENRVLAGTEDYELWLRLASRYNIYSFNNVTSVIVEHPQRSMSVNDFNAAENRILYFIDTVFANSAVTAFLGKNKSKFLSGRYRYLCLMAVLAHNRPAAHKYLVHMLKANFPSLIHPSNLKLALKALFV